MSTISAEILHYLSTIETHIMKSDIKSKIRDISLHNNELMLVIEPGTVDRQQLTDIEASYRQALDRYKESFHKIKIIFTNHLSQERIPHAQEKALHAMQHKISNVTQVIVIASGKGGVGKSTVATALAFSLTAAGYKVGLADLDIYGSSIPELFSIHTKPEVSDNGKLLPIIKYNIALMSLGLLVDPQQPVIWRGPMLTKAMTQILEFTTWGNESKPLDCLIIDTPPGTGDIHLTLASKYSIDGVVIVSTPQKLSLLNAHKSVEMYKKFNVPVWGMIENMSYVNIAGQKQYIFGQDGAKYYCAAHTVRLLGQIPLMTTISSSEITATAFETQEWKSFSSNIEDLLKACSIARTL